MAKQGWMNLDIVVFRLFLYQNSLETWLVVL
jgi:hypothetical protein